MVLVFFKKVLKKESKAVHDELQKALDKLANTKSVVLGFLTLIHIYIYHLRILPPPKLHLPQCINSTLDLSQLNPNSTPDLTT